MPILQFPDGKVLKSDEEIEAEEGARILREKTYFSPSQRAIHKVQENLEWLLHPVKVNAREKWEKIERKKFLKKNREHSRIMRKIRTILYKKTRTSPGEEAINDEPSMLDKIDRLTG